MKLTKTIYKNNNKVNEFIISRADAQNELVALLLQKIQKRYKIKIVTDRVKNTIEANLYFAHTHGNQDNYKYHYAFTNICESLRNEL